MDRQDHSKWVRHAQEAFENSIKVKEQIVKENLDVLVQMGRAIADSIKKGGKLFLCGNGGSAADAQHLAAELLVRLRPHVNRQSLPAIFLAMDMSTVTACGNDYSFEDIFSRPLEGLGSKGDVLLGITTSGKSPNVLKAFRKAKAMGILTLGFLGCKGGPAFELCDEAFVVPSDNTARIQESHITAGHIVMEFVEEMLVGPNQINAES